MFVVEKDERIVDGNKHKQWERTFVWLEVISTMVSFSAIRGEEMSEEVVCSVSLRDFGTVVHR